MELWLIRAGSSGEYEQKFLEDGRAYLTWEELDCNLAELPSKEALLAKLEQVAPEAKLKRLQNYSSQIWPFVHVMQEGDWVILPSKRQPVVYVGRICSAYQFTPQQPGVYRHWRRVEWFGQDIPRSHFGQDLRHSFGAFMTICRIRRNHALARLQAMHVRGWKAEDIKSVLQQAACVQSSSDEDGEEDAASNLETVAKQGIIALIESRFKGHELTRLVTEILKAQGYTVWQSPEGADGGVDILAATGAMGFGGQTICVEVKSGADPVDRPTVDKLLGAMSKFNAAQGLFVAWNGFKQNVQKELASSFFRMRLWSQDDLLDALFAVYDKLDDDLKAQLPLKRVWAVVETD
ncbi:restriction endonuclease [Chromobacterium haemolyticum]|uniref:restriction endonuclease n=1 Tax=Chromobacterium haemolyticum TaxID=394935 RepID=UPI0002FA7C97|nr:restriction endonuclease [Chromobacterium haemolyticum]